MTTFLNKRGMAGIIVAIIILSLLMTTSTAYIKIIQTEIQIASTIDVADRAMDAAFSGTQYAMAIAQTQDELFIDDIIIARQRLYMASDTTDAEIQNLWGSISPNDYVNNPNVIKSDWVFLDDDMAFMDDDDDPNDKPYLYMVAMYPKNDGFSNITNDTYYIKSKGIYRTYNSDGTIQKDFNYQIIAEVKINFIRKTQRLVRWRRQNWQSTPATFFVYDDY